MQYTRTLQFRLAALLSLAVLPAAVLAVVSSEATNNNTRAFKSAAIEQVATLVANGERLRLKKAAQLLNALANVSLSNKSSQCGSLLHTSQAIEPDIQDVRIIKRDGGIVCSTQQSGDQRDWDEVLASLPENAWSKSGPSFVVGSDFSLVAVPKASSDGALTLVLGLLRYRSPGLQVGTNVFRDDVNLLLVTSEGKVVGEVPKQISSLMSWLQSVAGGTAVPLRRQLSDSSAQEYLYVFAPIHETGAGVLIGGLRENLFGNERWRLWSSLSISFGMLLIVVGTAWIGVNKLVIRWIYQLRRAASSYASGNLEDRITNVDQMPAGIAEFASTFNRMADSIDERSTDLEQSLIEKSNLLRELHHRVKNNFQVIGSLLSLQKKTLDPQMQKVLQFPEERIQAMATAYRVSYASGDIGRVLVLRLMSEVSNFLCQNAGRFRGFIELNDKTDERLDISLDQAIPLAFLLTEILSPVVRSASQPPGVLKMVTVTLSCEGDTNNCKIEIVTPVPLKKTSEEENLRDRLCVAFQQQLAAEVKHRESDSTETWTITFIADEDFIAAA
jgi:two-component sensor histidine kinase